MNDRSGQPDEATRAASESPARALADALREAAILHQRGEIDAAAAGYRGILSHDPHHFAANHLLGIIELQGGRPANAVALLSQAIAIDAGDANAHLNLGAAYLAQGRADQARTSFDRAVALNPQGAVGWTKLGNALLALSQPAAAIDCYEHALALDARSIEAWNNKGFAHLNQGNPAAALGAFDRLLELAPRVAGFLNNRAEALRRLNRPAEAAKAYAAVSELAPDFDWVAGKCLGAALLACDWTKYAGSVAALEQGVLEGRRVCAPFEFLAVSGSARAQLICASTYSAKIAAAARAPDPGRSAPHPLGCATDAGAKLRIAYLSADFGNRSLALLLAGVLERHDRARFEIIGVALQPPDASAIGLRMARGVDRLIDVSQKSDRDVVDLMGELGIHIAVDLMGHTQGSRPAIFLRRAAPVQVAYLGYPGSTGLGGMDYLLADEFLIPPEDAAAYSERIVYLPDCFQANDDPRTIRAAPTRSQLGLPEDGFVFCCFNNSYKYNPVTFDIWCRLLAARDRSVLWLVADSAEAASNLRREARERDVDPARILFAGRVPYEQHLARQTAADLFLDTLPFNGGTTASDALRVGLPLLTCAGNAFASRMAGSLLRALDLPELITRHLADYEQRALDLSLPGSDLGALRNRLQQAVRTGPLFDTARFCRHLEAAYGAMWARHLSDAQSPNSGPRNCA